MPTPQDFPPLPPMSSAEIMANALSDPDNPPLTGTDLARLKPLPKARALRIRLRLTQEAIAVRCHIPLGVLRYIFHRCTPLCPAGHLPHKEGDWLCRCLAFAGNDSG